MPIELAAPDPEWPESFVRARDQLIERLGPGAFRAIEHTGSTSVPGLPAKPIVDMNAGVDDLGVVASFETALEELGYVPWFGAEGRISFALRDSAGRTTHHLHIVIFDGPLWRDNLAFRDALRSSDADRTAYLRLKRELAARFDDTRSYSAAKSDFVQAVLAKWRQRGQCG